MILVYALVAPSRQSPGVTGVKRERLRRISFPRVHAIVGTVASPPKPTGPAVRRYDLVIRTLADRFPSVLPARFGTCVADDEDLAFIVKARQSSFVQALRLVRNRVQMTIRVFDRGQSSLEGSDPSGGVRASLAGSELTKRGQSSGAQYLRERARIARDVPGTEPLRAAVRKWVTAERVERHKGQSFAGSVYHLVPRSAVRAYQRALERAAMADNLTTIVSGPWPPYAFADWDG